MVKAEFEIIFRYYIWGGKESYIIRKKMKEKFGVDNGDLPSFDLPAWGKLVGFAGLVIGAPQDIFECADVCRELSMRTVCGKNIELDKNLVTAFQKNKRIRQFSLGLSDYLVSACSLPKDLGVRVEKIFSEF